LWYGRDHRDGGINMSVRSSVQVDLHGSSDLCDVFLNLHRGKHINTNTFFLSNLR
jgi:hypothetical protein